jgi:hypothetical protein
VIGAATRGTPSTIRLHNRSASTLALDAWTLALGDDTVVLSDNAPAAVSTGTTDEAVARVADTQVDSADFLLAASTIGAANGSSFACTGVVINELVAAPRQDWSGGETSFDATPGDGAPDDGDQWVELYNCGDELDLAGWVVQIADSSATIFQLDTVDEENVAPTGQILRFSAGGSVSAFGTGEYLVIGLPAGSDDRVDDTATLRLIDGNDQLVDAASFGAELLGASEDLVVELGAPCSVGQLCWSDASVLPADGEASLLDEASAIRAHLQWGSATWIRGLDAETANVWPLERCSTRALGDDDVLSLTSGLDGTSPPDYR